jgi:signal transduction histidine kinase
LTEEERQKIAQHGRVYRMTDRGATIIQVRGHEPIAFAFIAAPMPALDLRSVGVTMALVLAALAVGSVLLVKNLTRPLIDLAAATRAFGAGDFAARAPLTRSDEIGDLAIAFNEMAKQVQRMRLAEKELLANISHELRTPLARIRVVLELAEDGPDAGERTYLREITTDMEEIERLLDDIIEVARFELVHARNDDAYPKLRLDATSVSALVQDVVDRFRDQKPSVHVDMDVTSSPLHVQCDQAYLRRVVANLLANAVLHGQGQGLHVTVGATQGGVDVAVRDRGPGIREADLPHVFEPFFRADASRSRHTGGFGLGLALCKRIVEAHGGKICVTSGEGQGTEVRFTLPANPHD